MSGPRDDEPPTERIGGDPPTRPMPRREHPAPSPEPPPPGHDRPLGTHSGLTVLLAAATGFLAGVVLLVAVGATGSETRTETEVAVRTVTVAPGPTTTPGTVIVTTQVPALVGERLDTARERLERARFDVDVVGGGLLGVIVEENWEVVAQDPPAGTELEQGSTVEVRIERR